MLKDKTMMKPAPSVQLYTVRDQIGNDLPGTLAKLAGIGFTHVELFDFVERVDEYKSALAENNLQVTSAHAIMMGNDLSPILQAAKSLGIKTLIDPWLPSENRQSVEQIKETAEKLIAISKQAEDYGISIGYHNHNWELEIKFDGITALEILESLLPANILLEIDAYWAEIGGASAPAILKKFGNRVQFLHIKDGTKNGDTSAQVPAGQGEIALAEVIKVAPHAAPIAEFDEYQGDIFTGLASSLSFIRQVQSE